ncbi:TPA: AI-2E family transporter [Clostridium botulinum]|uniref:AI-2E family transporter n=3 Tax=Clostridium TaxID=1485 RepID=A0ABC8CZM6_CLOBO|nr:MULTISPECIES: AI-2E family transporter [Clostridium]AUM96208.1 AI-2E family transporter [Clostridium sporogenes]AVQ39344.1 AI-2E family transporter [Clostridium botulinum]AVQ53662.1 AI-2E family transporter [Clostridium botulinum]EKO1912300.1 AI-2E family transporter [Clostridium botulinum]EKO2042361.1 AI-2E family transporter [Clostridium botulinum]
MRHYKHKYKDIIYAIIIFIIFFLLALLVKNYFKPFFIILVLLFLCNPIYNFLCSKKLFNNNVNSIISIILVNLILFLLIFLIGNFIYNHFILLKGYYYNFKTEIDCFIGGINKMLNINKYIFNKNLNNIDTTLLNGDFFRKGASYTTEWIFAYFIASISIYFILVDKYAILENIKKYIGVNEFEKIKDKIYKLKEIIKIECFLVIFTTFQTITGLKILNINNYLILGVLCGILDMLPYIGTVVIFLPLILYQFYTKNYVIFLGLICLYLLLIITRQILETKFMSSKLQLPALAIIISIYIGFKILGFLGLLLGPLYIITLKEFVKT